MTSISQDWKIMGISEFNCAKFSHELKTKTIMKQSKVGCGYQQRALDRGFYHAIMRHVCACKFEVRSELEQTQYE